MLRKVLTPVILAIAAVPAAAAPVLGTKEEGRALAKALVEIIDRDGIEAATQAVYDPDLPFVHSRQGVNLFTGSTVIADNREPEMVAADYSQTPDLTGELVWPRVWAAADIEDDAVLKWYHYDTQEVYDFHCFSMHANRDQGLVMVCR
ncbi:hypothetical protein RGUI_3232 [Rhodovulum sp. P5]|uniref:hypothetical protein n=1 Tax=Rhodovulum sp. P5 TaxID=1564506 RepID=UPI0009C35CA6|nr:hypothetical protein [Rhodovulum sp. P5]ARE41373.1 hypothetical protein RGUI_3232 [Rhodovulum sp. P5]